MQIFPNHRTNTSPPLLKKHQVKKLYYPTLATSSISLFGGASAFSGVIVAEATALAACKETLYIFTI